ncbi:FAD-binding protein [Candidatus Pelagibacter sp.]|uniref:FAD-binding protein n=1 Tax=Candidatus Pelagibacter sp. TaxID=2024849 RepID=UPI003F873FB3
MKKITSWGRSKFVSPNLIEPDTKESLQNTIISTKNFLTFGNGRSYGDVCLNKLNLICTRKLNKVILYKKKSGIIEVESGLLVSDLLPIILKDNFFLPVTAGTKFVTIGGMVANNVHGKNIKKNYFSDYIHSLKVFDVDGNLIECSKKKNKNFFDLTVGGIGLTGVIYSIRFQLKKINSLKLEKKNIFFKNLKNISDFKISNSKYDYAVTWLDSFSSCNNIRGIHFFTKHHKKKEKINFKIKKKRITFLHEYLFKLFDNFYLYRFVNLFFFLSHYLNFKKYTNLENFFYVQDKYIDWNKIYGKKGMIEFHILVPENFIIKFLNEFFFFCKKNKIFSNLIVLKRLKQKKKYINFSGDGVSFSADFSVNDNYSKIKNFFIKKQSKYFYNFYYAKDSVVSKKEIIFDKQFYMFKKKITSLSKNKKISSILSDRLGITK